MLWLLYNLVFLIGFVLLLPKYLWRMRRRGGYARDFCQRFGVYRPEVAAALAEGGRVWIHAVSVGEMYVGLKLLAAYRNAHPHARFVVSTTTSTGYRIAREKVEDPDVAIYFPIDLPIIVRRVLNRIRPRALILVEGEFWPNLVRLANRRGIPMFLVNGIISDHSYRGYRKLRVFTRRIFRLFQGLYVQGDKDRDILLDLGAPPDRVKVLHSAKYEVAEANPAGEARAGRILAWAGMDGDRPVLLGGSTWAGEEEILIDLFQELRGDWPDLALVLAPRHFERSHEVVADLERRAQPFVRRTDWTEGADRASADVLLVDSTGELVFFYPRADVIFVGKSLTADGGQNIIEPALFGKPIVVGPRMSNFPVVMRDFLAANAIRQVPDAGGLKTAVADLLRDRASAEAMGERAAQLVRDRAGAIGETVKLIDEHLAGRMDIAGDKPTPS